MARGFDRRGFRRVEVLERQALQECLERAPRGGAARPLDLLEREGRVREVGERRADIGRERAIEPRSEERGEGVASANRAHIADFGEQFTALGHVFAAIEPAPEHHRHGDHGGAGDVDAAIGFRRPGHIVRRYGRDDEDLRPWGDDDAFERHRGARQICGDVERCNRGEQPAHHEERCGKIGDRRAFGRAYNVSGEESITQVGFVELIAEVIERPASLVHVAKAPFGQNLVYDCHAVYTTTRIRAELGLRPRYTLTSGLAQTFEWYLREGLDRRDVDFSQDDALLAAART